MENEERTNTMRNVFDEINQWNRLTGGIGGEQQMEILKRYGLTSEDDIRDFGNYMADQVQIALDEAIGYEKKANELMKKIDPIGYIIYQTKKYIRKLHK